MAVRNQSLVSWMALLTLTVLSFWVIQVNPEECPFWKENAALDAFQQYIVAANELAHINIGVRPEFGVNESFALAQLLMKVPISVRVLRETSGLRQRRYSITVRQDHHALVLVFCKATTWNISFFFFINP